MVSSFAVTVMFGLFITQPDTHTTHVKSIWMLAVPFFPLKTSHALGLWLDKHLWTGSQKMYSHWNTNYTLQFSFFFSCTFFPWSCGCRTDSLILFNSVAHTHVHTDIIQQLAEQESTDYSIRINKSIPFPWVPSHSVALIVHRRPLKSRNPGDQSTYTCSCGRFYLPHCRCPALK